MRSLTYIRNLCAHHGRLWKRVFTIKVEADKRYNVCREESFQAGKIYSQIVVINIISPDNHFQGHIKNLLDSFSEAYICDSGFPKGWKGFDIHS